ncbi:unnamed protein product [Pocillopora meandrina]|uniref:G-protein coupled receptors family 1 profile domain-containing protein n=1 Tax=Pocillopora meandrina TaxID=46732 RepID=A0AAU9Y1E2_9CNID|nr:unnamed protein product [Pocillopora meandrina]
MAMLSPVAVVGNAIILATIWRRTFPRTTFHILLSGIALSDLCTGLIAQPCYAASILISPTKHSNVKDNPKLAAILHTVGEATANFFVSVTILTITAMSIERWLYMSRGSFITCRRRYFALIVVLFLPVPTVVILVLIHQNFRYRKIYEVIIITQFSFCYTIVLFAYYKVYKIIRRHEQQIKASEVSAQRFGQNTRDPFEIKLSKDVLNFSSNVTRIDMTNNTTLSCEERLVSLTTSNDDDFRTKQVSLSTSIIVAALSPVAVVANFLILAAIWKRNFLRTPFHILLSGLAFNDLCTGLIAQPLYAATLLIYSISSTVICQTPVLVITIRTIGESAAVAFITMTILTIAVMSIERWLHMSRRSLITWHSGCLTVLIVMTLETYFSFRVSVVFLFLSSSLNPALYIWRMRDIRHGVKQLRDCFVF